MEQDNHIDRQKLIWGAILVTVGTVLTLGNFDLVDLRQIWRFWPLILIAVGIGKLFDPKELSSGFTSIGFGCWFLIGNFRLFGLTYRESWPIILIFAGVGIVITALSQKSSTATQVEENHGTR